jgi:RNA polymerase sigma factor (sigma-70 family)
MDDDTAAAIEAWQTRGDQAAGRWLVAEHYAQVLGIVRANLPRRTEEADLVQDVFLKMFAKLDSFDGRVPFAHWLSRVTLHTCFDALRAERRRPELRWSDLSLQEADVLSATLADQRALPPGSSLAARELLYKLLESLSPQDRLVLKMLVIDEKTVAEIARLTGWSRPVVKIRVFRARLKLKQQLTKLSQTKPPR